MDWSSVSGLTKSLLPTQQVELEELEQILDEGNQPRLSERGDEDEDPEGGTGSNPTASSSSQSEGSPSPAEPRSPRFYAQVHNSVSGVGKYIVEQAQRPTVVVGAVAGVRAFGAPAALCIPLDLTLTRSCPPALLCAPSFDAAGICGCRDRWTSRRRGGDEERGGLRGSQRLCGVRGR
uniref:Uncharacterized protein n=1 Tax=Chloropicon roscoffensis TaxID=1461544 RepID=A0A7S3C8S7_9CHLO